VIYELWDQRGNRVTLSVDIVPGLRAGDTLEATVVTVKRDTEVEMTL
jgi:hypothetical protein